MGVVKAVSLHDKNPAQHAVDLAMLQKIDKLSGVFFHNSEPKPIDCIRVDWAADKGSSHEEVQFWYILIKRR